MGRAGRWMVAGLATTAAFALTTWVSGVFLFTRLLPSPDVRWPTAFAIGAAAAAFTGLWGQSWATESGGQVSAEQLAPHERREQEARDQLRQHLGRQDRLRRMDDHATSALALRVHPALSLPRDHPPAAAPGDDTSGRLIRRRRFLPRQRRNKPGELQTPDQDLPAFVGRDKGPEITSWMRQARRHGGFLVLVGDSSVGKIRLLYETARDVLPDFAVLAPDLGDGHLVNSIAAATFPLPKLIVWLDELQRYLDGPYLTPGSTPITATTVRHLLDAPTPVVVLGAMWLEHVAQQRATEPDPNTHGQRPRYPGAADILGDRRVQLITVTSFSGTERQAAAKLASKDPRLKSALADPHYNVTEVLAGAPQLIARYEQASEEQQAVLNAAIDARRLGIQAPLTSPLLRTAACGYLRTLHPDGAWFPPALTELTRHDRPQDHATAPLIPVLNQEKSEILGYTVADYLIQHASRERRSAWIPATTWDALRDHRDPADAARLADSAAQRLLYRYAIPLYRHAADAGDGHSAGRLAGLLADRGDLDEALQILRARADAGDENAFDQLAYLLADCGDLDEARQILRARADAGDWYAAWRLAGLLAEHGNLDELRARADAGDGHSAGRLAGLLAEHGNLDELRARADAGDGHSAGRLAGLLAERGDLDEARQILRVSAGDDPAAGLLPGLLDELRARADAGDDPAVEILGEWLTELGDRQELRALADAGDKYAAIALARQLARHKDLGELRARADHGDEDAALMLAGLLADRGNLNELRGRADAGDEAADGLLVGQLAERGNLDELRARADTGDWDAAELLADQLAGRGNLDELRARASTGNWSAARRLADLLADRGDLDEALQILRTVAAAGTATAEIVQRLGRLLTEQGQAEEAELLYRFGLNPDGSTASE